MLPCCWPEEVQWSRSVVSDSMRPHGLEPARLHGILQARILQWVAISFSRGSSRLRDWTQVSCTAGISFNLWATREAHDSGLLYFYFSWRLVKVNHLSLAKVGCSIKFCFYFLRLLHNIIGLAVDYIILTYFPLEKNVLYLN